ncbi:efflux RND transporter periplasmic adaptor subunit [Paraburkholderia antibiotica]|uniref:Efflux RND transporter periplasmic adaptor subunit n=1 Tax=Paraburkholderia antibiotica TaxID=2728839 RepID=A0A7X9ZW33_9BURK|nr:efflux RND transporter periplasmic adaptor subunit [Paraburkholderia antibiotica]NML30547.1 efflux RND transporter periplasmic adaptor subunit [Paraburkholderia antibiotica]
MNTVPVRSVPLRPTACALLLAVAALSPLVACKKAAPPPAATAAEVTVTTVTQQDTPVDFEFTAQTQSSREVEIRSRVDGFLDKRTYTEGQLVKTGQTMFQMDRKPFEAALQTAKGELAQQQARLEVAKANLARVQPLAAQNALSKKDLDDAVGNEKQSAAAVISAQGEVDTALLNLGYTTIKSPLNGLSSFARQQDGSYVTATSNGLLTYVYQLDPMWVNFSISENEMLKYRDEIAAGRLKFPSHNDFVVHLVLADGSLFAEEGHIDFANPAFNTETGTFLVRAVFDNPHGTLRPGQFVRARISGALRPNATLVPQRAVLQGAKSHFVWVVGADSKAHQQVVEVGDWQGDQWFISDGLKAGERIVVDGALRVTSDAPLKIVKELPASRSSTAVATAASDSAAAPPATETPGPAAHGSGGTSAE